MNAKTKKSRFGSIPDRAEKTDNLKQPEHAPKAPKKKARVKTGRTETFSTRVHPKFLKEFKNIAFKNDLKLVELLEASLEAFKREKAKKQKS